MSYTEEEIIGKFNSIMIQNTNRYSKYFSVSHFTQETFNSIDKSCSIMYHLVYEKDKIDSIHFQILLNVNLNLNLKPLALFGLFDESCEEDIFEFYKYLLQKNDNDRFYWYMNHLKNN